MYGFKNFFDKLKKKLSSFLKDVFDNVNTLVISHKLHLS